MNILFICSNMPPMVDGVGDYTYNIASEFARHGHEVHVICHKRKEIRTDYDDLHIVPMVERWARSTGKRIAQYVKDKNIDVVSLQYVPHGFEPHGLPFGLVPCMKEVKKTGVKMMVFCHEVCLFGPATSLTVYVMQRATKFVTRKLLHLFDFVATSIEYYSKLITELDNRKNPKVFPIVSNVPLVEMTIDGVRDLRRKVANYDETIIAFFGLRDVDLSIEAIQRLRQDGMKIKVLFIGKLPMNFKHHDLENSFKTDVLDVNELGQYMKIPDVLLIPEKSYYGCSFKSGSLAAAMQNGLPVVTGKGILTSDTLIDNQNIVFADFSDMEDVYGKLKKLCTEREFRCNIGKSAALLLSDRTWNKTYEQYMKLLEE